MREFKFRAWGRDGIEPLQMYHWEKINNVIDAWFADKKAVVMQYIGLTDRNNTEIYEGDIVKIKGHWSKTMPLIQEVIYEGATFLPFDDSDWGWVSSESEVIGNKYENPELLRGD